MPHLLPSLRRAGAVAAALTGLVLVAPTASAASSTTAQTTDQANDARINLRKIPTADLLAAGGRFGADTVTFFVDLSAAPSTADLGSGAYTFTTSFNGGALFVRFDQAGASIGQNLPEGSQGGGEPSPACVAYFGSADASVRAPVQSAAGELSATFRRADVNAVATCVTGGLLAGATVDGANSEYHEPPRGLLGGGIARDSAGPGSRATFPG